MGRVRGGVEELLGLGSMLQSSPDGLVTVARGLLIVRDKEGRERPLRPNAVQMAFERERGQRNIVLKARQMGMTTWIAGRFF